MRWLNSTDLRITPDDAEKNLTFRQVGWLGFSGKYYPLGEDPSKTEKGGFSIVYVQLGD